MESNFTYSSFVPFIFRTIGNTKNLNCINCKFEIEIILKYDFLLISCYVVPRLLGYYAYYVIEENVGSFSNVL